jgi:multisubunit Na+/H+ antiporter MnhC subunit
MKRVFITSSENEAVVIKGLLRASGIYSILKRESIRALYGITINGLGKIEILVAEDDFEKAKRVIQKNFSNY